MADHNDKDEGRFPEEEPRAEQVDASSDARVDVRNEPGDVDTRPLTEEEEAFRYAVYEWLTQGAFRVFRDDRAVHVAERLLAKFEPRIRRCERKPAGYYYRAGANKAKDEIKWPGFAVGCVYELADRVEAPRGETDKQGEMDELLARDAVLRAMGKLYFQHVLDGKRARERRQKGDVPVEALKLPAGAPTLPRIRAAFGALDNPRMRVGLACIGSGIVFEDLIEHAPGLFTKGVCTVEKDERARKYNVLEQWVSRFAKQVRLWEQSRAEDVCRNAMDAHGAPALVERFRQLAVKQQMVVVPFIVGVSREDIAAALKLDEADVTRSIALAMALAASKNGDE